jgi:hypothetical protein
MKRSVYAILGAVVGAVVDVLINLIAASIQKLAFADQFSLQAVGGLAVLAVIGLLLGYWLGKPLHVPAFTAPRVPTSQKPDMVTITRLQALWSHNDLKGKGGIHLTDVFQLGSKTTIDTKD